MENINEIIFYNCDADTFKKLLLINKYMFNKLQPIIYNKFEVSYYKIFNCSGNNYFDTKQFKILNNYHFIERSDLVNLTGLIKFEFDCNHDILEKKYKMEDLKHLKNIQHIELSSYNKLSRHIFKHFNNITHLDLHHSLTIIDDDIKIFNNLKILTLGQTKITDEGIKDLTTLEMLKLSDYTYITDNGIKGLINLSHLTLNNNITINGIKNLNNLTSLDINTNINIKNDDLNYLTRLKKIVIKGGYGRYNKINDINILTNLDELNIVKNDIIHIDGISCLIKLQVITISSYNTNHSYISKDDLKKLSFYKNLKIFEKYD